MTILKEERDTAIDLVGYYFIDVLRNWLSREKNSLDSFIADPTGHINYNPYIIPNYEALALRSSQLEMASHALGVISAYKQGLGVTRGQHDVALDAMPSILFIRLVEWVNIRYTQNLDIDLVRLAPISEYNELFSFDVEKHQEDLNFHKNAIDGLNIVIDYAREQEAIPPEE